MGRSRSSDASTADGSCAAAAVVARKAGTPDGSKTASSVPPVKRDAFATVPFATSGASASNPRTTTTTDFRDRIACDSVLTSLGQGPLGECETLRTMLFAHGQKPLPCQGNRRRFAHA